MFHNVVAHALSFIMMLHKSVVEISAVSLRFDSGNTLFKHSCEINATYMIFVELTLKKPLENLPAKSSCGYDDISSIFLKHITTFNFYN